MEELKINSNKEFADSFLGCIVANEDQEGTGEKENVTVKLYATIKEKDQKIAEVSEKNEQLIEEVRRLTRISLERAEVDLQNKELKRLTDAKVKEHEALLEQMTKIETTVSVKEKEICSLKGKLEDAQAHQESTEYELSLMRKTLKQAEQTNDMLNDELECRKHENNKEAQDSTYAQLCEQLKRKEQEVQYLEENVAYSEHEFGEVLNQLREKERVVELIQTGLTDESAKRLQFQEKLSDVSIENQRLSKQVTDLTAQLERSRTLPKCSPSVSFDGIDPNLNVVSPEEVSSNKENESKKEIPCIFEVRGEGRCNRGVNCVFDHTFDPKIRHDAEVVKQLIEETSKKYNKCALEMVDKVCPRKDDGCPFPHKKVPSPSTLGIRVCFRELMQEGSCFRGAENCKFSHKISMEQRNDEGFVEKVRKVKDEKASKCVNEFNLVGSCTKKLCCPFSHSITEEDRKNPVMKKKMLEKRSSFHEKKANPAKPTNTSDHQKESIVNEGAQGLLMQMMSKVIELLERKNP